MPVKETTYHAHRPRGLCAGGFVEKKRGEWMLRRADELRAGRAQWTVTRTWLPGRWPEEFYERR